VSSVSNRLPRWLSSRRQNLQRTARTQLPRAGTPEPHKVHLHNLACIAAFIPLGTDPACIVLCIGHKLPPGNWTRYHPCHASRQSTGPPSVLPSAHSQRHSSPATRPAEAPARLIPTLTKPVCLGSLVQSVQELHDDTSWPASLQVITTASLRQEFATST
jgi:hypothetical protein